MKTETITETIIIEVKYEISFKTEQGREDAIKDALRLELDAMGAGVNGLYRAKRGKARLDEQGRNQTV